MWCRIYVNELFGNRLQISYIIGRPVMRPMFLDFEQDFPGAYINDYQYMFGDDLLVAPVTEPNVDKWRVYLPGIFQS